MAVYKDRGVGPCFNFEVAVLRRYPEKLRVTILNGEDIRDGALKNFDVIMVPGGSGRGEAHSLEKEGQDEIRRFVREGGVYVGTCAGCYLATDAEGYMGLLPVGVRDRAHWHRGKSFLPIQFTREGGQVFGVDDPDARILYHNGPVLDCRRIEEHPEMQENFVPLSFFRGEIVAPGGEVGVMKGAPAMVLTRYGKGLVLGMSPHPEQTPHLQKIIPKALEWLCEHVNQPGPAAALFRQETHSPQQ